MGLHERRNILCPCVISSVPILLELRIHENLPSLFKTTNWSITLKQVLYTYNSAAGNKNVSEENTNASCAGENTYCEGEFLVTGHFGTMSVWCRVGRPIFSPSLSRKWMQLG